MNNDPQAALKRAFDLLNSGLLDQAEAAFRPMLSNDPDNAAALQGMAAVQFGRGNIAEAVSNSTGAIKRDPGNTDLLLHHAQYLHAAGQSDAAKSALRKAGRQNPRDGFTLYNLGVLHLILDDFANAKKCLIKANRRTGDDPQILHALGTACAELGDIAQARQHLTRSVELDPDLAAAHFQLGNLYFHTRQLTKAAEHLEHTISLDDTHDEAYVSLSAVRFRLGDTEGAIAACRKALATTPDDAGLHLNLAKFLSVQGDLSEAINSSRRAFELAPDDADIGGTYYQFLRQAVAWDYLDAVSDRLDALYGASMQLGKPYAELPFVNIFRVAEPSINYQVARSRITQISKGIPSDQFTGRTEKRRRTTISEQKSQPIKIAYLSSDFRDHPTSHLMQNFFKLHDREKFRVSAYSHGPDDRSNYRKTIAESCDRFIDISRLTDGEAADMIAKDDIDILIDLNVHITGERMEICAHRPAPVQISMLAYPGTSGANFYDYLVGDETVAPASEENHFSEKFIVMPDTYFLTNHEEVISDYPSERADFGLPTEHAVFACFNNAYKIEPSLFAGWMDILRAAPGSVLWLFSRSVLVQGNIRRQAQNHGIDAGRLVFADDLPKPEHLARLSLADMALDTGIYGGHTTTADALRAGLPVITTVGTHFASRASSSILSAMGMTDLIAENMEAYVSLAGELAQNTAKLADLKTRVRLNVETAPLFNGERYIHHLEAGLLEAHRLWLTGGEPRHIETKNLLGQAAIPEAATRSGVPPGWR